MLDELLAVKRCRERGVRSRVKRLQQEMDSSNRLSAEHVDSREVLRSSWRALSLTTGELSMKELGAFKRHLSKHYLDDQQLSAQLVELERKISSLRRECGTLEQLLRSLLRGQEKLTQIIEEYDEPRANGPQY